MTDLELTRAEAGLAARACLHEADMLRHATVRKMGMEGTAKALGAVGSKLRAFANQAEAARKCEACFNGHDRPCTDEAGCPCPCSYLDCCVDPYGRNDGKHLVLWNLERQIRAEELEAKLAAFKAAVEECQDAGRGYTASLNRLEELLKENPQ